MNEFIDYLFEDFKCGFDKAKPRDGGTIEAYEFRADCFTYDEIDGNWTRHRPTRNRTFIVETQKPYPDEYHDRYFDQMSLFLGDGSTQSLNCRPLLGPYFNDVLFHENVAFAASTSLANGKWIVAGGVTGNNSIWGGGECAVFLRKAAKDTLKIRSNHSDSVSDDRMTQYKYYPGSNLKGVPPGAHELPCNTNYTECPPSAVGSQGIRKQFCDWFTPKEPMYEHTEPNRTTQWLSKAVFIPGSGYDLTYVPGPQFN